VGQSKKNIFLSIFDQGVCSLSNFITAIIAARLLLPEEFAIYVMLFTAVVMLGGIQNSLILTPLRILGIKPEREQAQDYILMQLILQLVLSTAISLIAMVFLFCMELVNSTTIIVFSVTVFTIQLHEFFRVFLITQLKIQSVTLLDISIHGFRVIGLLTLYWLDLKYIELVFLILLLAPVLSLLCLRFITPMPLSFKKIKELVTENWSFGKWILIETVFFSLSTHLYLYLTAVTLSLESAAGLAACLNIINIVNIFIMGVSSYGTTIARTKLMKSGIDAWRNYLIKISILILIVTLFFLIMVNIFSEILLKVFFGDFYASYASLIFILSFAYILMPINTILAMSFRTLEKPQIGVISKVISAVVTSICAYPLLNLLAENGAAIGMFLTQFVWALVYLYYLKKGLLNEYQKNF